MGYSREKLFQRGYANIPVGERHIIQPALQDQRDNVLVPDLFGLPDGFFIASKQADGSFDVQNLNGQSDLFWSCEFVKGRVDLQPINGSVISPRPPLVIGGGGASDRTQYEVNASVTLTTQQATRSVIWVLGPGPITITLPASPNVLMDLHIKREPAMIFDVTVAAAAQIDDQPSFILEKANDSLHILGKSSTYRIV